MGIDGLLWYILFICVVLVVVWWFYIIFKSFRFEEMFVVFIFSDWGVGEFVFRFFVWWRCCKFGVFYGGIVGIGGIEVLCSGSVWGCDFGVLFGLFVGGCGFGVLYDGIIWCGFGVLYDRMMRGCDFEFLYGWIIGVYVFGVWWNGIINECVYGVLFNLIVFVCNRE